MVHEGAQYSFSVKWGSLHLLGHPTPVQCKTHILLSTKATVLKTLNSCWITGGEMQPMTSGISPP